jgi:hypothetical protein
MTHRIARLVLALATICLAALHANAGANDPGFISYDPEKHLAAEAKLGPEAVARMLGWLIDSDDGAGNAEWLDLATRFETRAQMVEINPSFQQKVEWSFGASAAELRLVAQAIRNVLGQRPPKPSDPAKQKLHWVEVVYLDHTKHGPLSQTSRARFSAAAEEIPLAERRGFGSSIVYSVGETFVFELYADKPDFVRRMAGIVREVSKELGGRW